jgi:hypothetical protein
MEKHAFYEVAREVYGLTLAAGRTLQVSTTG